MRNKASGTERGATLPSDTRIRVWCLLRDQFDHVKPVEEHLGDSAAFIYDSDWGPERMADEMPDIVLCVNDFHYDVARCLDMARNRAIPTLVLQDGVLEWRCQYQNPLFGAGGGAPQHQPVLADKIACIGNQSGRHIAAWGNHSRVEVTGMPRLDRMLARAFPSPQRPGRRLLVMTAKKPWFDDAQKDVTLRSLRDLKAHLDTRRDIQVIWRLTKNVASLIGVENRLTELGTAELAAVLAEADAVISTLSTAILECMLAGRPVAALDYHNTPRFLDTAWSISGPEQIGQVLSELLDPPQQKMSAQGVYLSDALRSDGPAAQHVGALMTIMAEFGKKARTHGRPMALPPALLGLAVEGARDTAAGVDLAALYPKSGVFQESDAVRLQVMLVRAQAEIERLKAASREHSMASLLAKAYRKAFK